MASWAEFEAAAPELAGAVGDRFESHLHHVLGTLTADGSPRLSGTEARLHDGELWLGCMPASVKARDLKRDPRFSLHSAPVDVEMTDGDAKVSGRVVEVTDQQRLKDWLTAIGHGNEQEDVAANGAGDSATDDGGEAALSGVLAFVCDLDAATLTKVAGDHLEIATWTPSRGLVVREVR
jgi:hypothetical protein